MSTTPTAATARPMAPPDPAAITCPDEALAAAELVAGELRSAKAAPRDHWDHAKVQELGKLHQALLLRRRELKAAGKPPSRPAPVAPAAPPAAAPPPDPVRPDAGWRSAALARQIDVPAIDTLTRRERAILRAELQQVEDSCEWSLQHGDQDGPRRSSAAAQLRRARFYLQVLAAIEEANAAPETIGAVFQQVARCELDPVTYQRMVLMAQQRLILNRTTTARVDRS